MPKGDQSVKFGLTDGLVGGAIKAALSMALNCPEPTKLFDITSEICLPIWFELPSLSVKSAMATGSGYIWPELILIVTSSANTLKVIKPKLNTKNFKHKRYKLLFKIYASEKIYLILK